MIFPRSGRIAWYVRSRPIFAEPPALSPSTMNSSAADGSLIEQSASLPASDDDSSALLRRVSSRAFARREPRAHGSDALVHDLSGVRGVLLEELRELLIDGSARRAHAPTGCRASSCLPLELRVLELDRDDAGEPLADVLAVERLVFLMRLLSRA
jgi:hypothetical protein